MTSEILTSYVDGRWADAKSQEQESESPLSQGTRRRLAHPVQDPSTGAQIALAIWADRERCDQAVTAARRELDRFRAWSPRERADLCSRAAELVESGASALAHDLSEEQGKPLAEALGEVHFAAQGLRYFGEEAVRGRGSIHFPDDPAKRVLVIRQPRGVWAFCTPWNFPLNIPVEYIGPALATGSPFVWKPAPTTPRIAVRLIQILERAGAPPGVANLLLLDTIGAEHLVTHPGVDAVGLTGSSGTGRRVAQLAWDKHLLLELGGNGPVIVLADADAERAAPALARASFWNGGQVCTAAGRILVSEALGDEVADRVTELAEGLVLGPPRQRSVTMGPVHLETVATTVDRHVSDAVDRGARLLTGGGRAEGHPSALFFRPTVIDHVSPDSHVFAEETFGPVAPITRFSDDDELLRLVSRRRYGLGAAVFTESLSAAMSLAERLEAGLISINESSNYWEHSLPFGGWGGTASGRGRLGGAAAIAEFTQTKTICLDISRPASAPAKARGKA